VRITWLYSIGLLSGSIVFGLLSPLLLEYFISPDYGAASDFVFWVALGFAFNGIYKMFVNYLFYIKETKAIGVATFSTAILNLILNYFFIQRFGAIGAAYSTALCFLIQLVWIAILATKKYSMPWLNFIAQK
jgi:O-antigen/teichoic acid export membrane protein